MESDLSEADQSYEVVRVMKCLVMTKILFHAPQGLDALLRVDTEKINLLEKN